jgi:CMP-N-acetylneuraminic acid synthetase
MNILITICARKGSKRIKDKNTRELAGKPLLVHTIDIAKKWGEAKRIICSTDSKEIAKMAKTYGAEVPFIRPRELATDESGKIPVIRHALNECEKKYKEKYDLIVDLDVTSPIRTKEDLDNCLKKFNENKPEVLFSVVNSRKNPYFNMVEINDNNFAELSKSSTTNVLRIQGAPKVYDMNASIYFYSREFLLNPDYVHVLSSKRSAIYVMNDISAFDIDNELDFKFIEFLIKERMAPS